MYQSHRVPWRCCPRQPLLYARPPGMLGLHMTCTTSCTPCMKQRYALHRCDVECWGRHMSKLSPTWSHAHCCNSVVYQAHTHVISHLVCAFEGLKLCRFWPVIVRMGIFTSWKSPVQSCGRSGGLCGLENSAAHMPWHACGTFKAGSL